VALSSIIYTRGHQFLSLTRNSLKDHNETAVNSQLTTFLLRFVAIFRRWHKL